MSQYTFNMYVGVYIGLTTVCNLDCINMDMDKLN